MRLAIAIRREDLLRFLIAVLGLALAFAAAILSTAARESGNTLATVVLASSALMLAAAVAVAILPYLARRVLAVRMRQALDYQLTREGMVYLAFVLAIAIAALNTGNNMLFLIVSALLAAVIVSGVASALQLRGLEMEASIPEQAFAGRKYPAHITLRNRRRWLPVFSVSVVPPKQAGGRQSWRWRRTTFEFPNPVSGRNPWVRWPDLKLMRMALAPRTASILGQPVYFPCIGPRASAIAELNLCFERRGLYVQNAFGISTRFPFSFLVKTRAVRLARELIVYPAVEPTEEIYEALPLITGELESYIRGRGHDLYLIRDYLPDDSARHVDWKSSAKSGTLKVREFTREDERRLRIVFDNAVPGQTSPEVYERGVRLAASFAWYFTQENASLTFAAHGLTENTLTGFLRYLALVEPEQQPSIVDSLPPAQDFNLVLTWKQPGSISNAVWRSSYVLFLTGDAKS